MTMIRRRIAYLAWAVCGAMIGSHMRMATGLLVATIGGRPRQRQQQQQQQRRGSISSGGRHYSPVLDTTTRTTTTTRLNLAVDPYTAVTSAAELLQSSSASTTNSALLLSFADQGQNLAGIFFQASLLPYLFFLYFLQFRANGLNSLSNFGFQYVLLFVLATIPSGILSKSVYGQTLANTDWLHGGAELLLTVANIIVVSHARVAMIVDCDDC
jgi:Protein of unknown function (DUF3593)